MNLNVHKRMGPACAPEGVLGAHLLVPCSGGANLVDEFENPVTVGSAVSQVQSLGYEGK